MKHTEPKLTPSSSCDQRSHACGRWKHVTRRGVGIHWLDSTPLSLRAHARACPLKPGQTSRPDDAALRGLLPSPEVIAGLLATFDDDELFGSGDA